MPLPLARRAVLLSGLLLLAGCDDEPKQRQAFITFLKERILDRPGVHVPRPTDELTKAWGPYAKHYAVIVDFNDAVTRRVSRPMQDAMQRGAVRSLQELTERRADIETLGAGMRALGTALDEELVKAEAARAALQQPADLKPVFDAAFERDVTGPARLFKEVIPVVDEGIRAALDFSDYIAQHRSAIRMQGSLLQVTDPAVEREVRAQMEAMNAKGREIQAIQGRLRAAITGN